MSGVRTGTRLDQLRTLQKRTRHEIAAAKRREDRYGIRELEALAKRIDDEIALIEPPVIFREARTSRGTVPLDQMLADLGVSSTEVKEWGVAQGLLDAVKRGRVSRVLVETYAAAHREAS